MVQNFLTMQKKPTTAAIKATSKKAIQKTAKATGDLIGHKIADKMFRKKSWTNLQLQNNEANYESEAQKERYISPDKR